MKRIILCFLFSLNVFSQGVDGIEEQRKYVFSRMDQTVLNLLDQGAVVSGLTIKKHSTYDYMDIYLDSKEFDLFHHKLSLRFRRRVYEDNSKAFGMQIKSEMLKNGDVRMEVEEDELNFYKVIHEGKTYLLQDVVNNFFERYLAIVRDGVNTIADDEKIKEYSAILTSWLKFKLDGPVAPLQKLKHLKNKFKSITTLQPVMIGRSLRGRSHIFINKKETTPDLVNFAPSERNPSETPAEIASEQFIWTMEGSFDQAQFYSLINKATPHKILEFEIENKYLPHENARVLFNRLENGLIKEYGVQINLESKYRQSAKQFFNLK